MGLLKNLRNKIIDLCMRDQLILMKVQAHNSSYRTWIQSGPDAQEESGEITTLNILIITDSF